MPSPQQRGSGATDEAIWKRLREAGFDEESVKRRDKAALIAYITKLESEIYDYQHHMGLLILERKELTSKYDQVKATSESAEIAYKQDQAAKSTALAEARRREESLKKALAIEKKCVENIEKALHDMHAVSAETKVAYESNLAEARAMVESAQKKFDEAEYKLQKAESLHAEASRCRDTASRNLQDVEVREDDLRRKLISFMSECEAKETEIKTQRQSLQDSQKILYQEQERLLEGKTLLNQREEYIFDKSKELSRFEKELGELKAKLEDECRALKEKKSNLELDKSALGTREEAVIRRESMLDRKERELLILQEKIASKEYDEIQRLKDENQYLLEKKMKELEAEVEQRRLSLEDEILGKVMACEVKEADLIHRENLVQEREFSCDCQLSSLEEKQVDITKRLKLVEEKEQNLHSTKKEVEMSMVELQKERAEIQAMKADIEKMKGSLEDKRKEILHAQENLEITTSERNELLLLETKLKEEIDSFRAQKQRLLAEADKLKADKEKFEIDWELIDEKREELRNEAERVEEERKAVSKYLKNEHDSIKLEKENFRNQFKQDVESLTREREEFMSKMEREHSDWFNKIQQEREDFARDIMIQRKELENCIDKKREELEIYLREKEETFEQERANELQIINSQKETISKELEHVASELKRLDKERVEIALDREKREREWAEINSSIDLLDIQREKLQKQRELLHADREEIYIQIQQLKKLEDSSFESENRALSEIHPRHLNSSIWKVPMKRCSNTKVSAQSIDDPNPSEQRIAADGGITPKLRSDKALSSASPPISATISWIRKVIFRHSPEKVDTTCETNIESQMLTNTRQVSVGSGIKFKNTSDVTGMNGSESIERKETLSKRSNLEESYALAGVTSLGESGGSLINTKPRNATGKSISQLNEDGIQEDRCRDRYGSADDVNLLLSGRKRLNSVFSQDHDDIMLEPRRKHHKQTRQKGRLEAKETTSNCVLSTQTTFSDDDSGSPSLIQTLGFEGVSIGCTDRDEDNPIIFCSTPPVISLDAALELDTDATENGRLHGSENTSHVGNGTSSSKMLKSREPAQETVSKKTENLPTEIAEEQAGYKEDSDERVVDEDHEKATSK